MRPGPGDHSGAYARDNPDAIIGPGVARPVAAPRWCTMSAAEGSLDRAGRATKVSRALDIRADVATQARLMSLVRASQLINSTLVLDEVLERVMDAVIDV